MEASGGVLGVKEPPELVPAPAGGGCESDAPPPVGGSGAASGFLGRAGALPSSGAVWAPSSELIAGFLPAQFGRILNVYHTAQPRCAAGPRPAWGPGKKDRRVKFRMTVRQPRTRRRSPSTSNQAAHAAPRLAPTPCAVIPMPRLVLPTTRPLPSGAQPGTACRSPISPHCTSRRQSGRHPPSPPPPRRARAAGHTLACAPRASAHGNSSREPRAALPRRACRRCDRRPGDAGRRVAAGRPKVGRPRRHAFGVRHDCQGRADASSGGGPAGAGQVMRRRMRASAGAPCILVRAMRQAGRAPRCPPGAAFGQARPRAGGGTHPRAIPHRILRAACPARGPGRVGEASRPASCRTPGAQMRPRNCAPLFQIGNVRWMQKPGGPGRIRGAAPYGPLRPGRGRTGPHPCRKQRRRRHRPAEAVRLATPSPA